MRFFIEDILIEGDFSNVDDITVIGRVTRDGMATLIYCCAMYDYCDYTILDAESKLISICTDTRRRK